MYLHKTIREIQKCCDLIVVYLSKKKTSIKLHTCINIQKLACKIFKEMKWTLCTISSFNPNFGIIHVYAFISLRDRARIRDVILGIQNIKSPFSKFVYPVEKSFIKALVDFFVCVWKTATIIKYTKWQLNFII